MLEPIPDLPDGVIGFQANGKIQASDYTDVLIPAVRAVIDSGARVRMVLVFPTFEGMTPSATWEDVKFGFKNLKQWQRFALVTDLDWLITATSLFGWMMPGEFKRFPMSERDAAIAWAATPTD